MARLMLRKCAWCDKVLGCYNPAKRECHDCRMKTCPTTRLVSHGLCPVCQRDISLLA